MRKDALGYKKYQKLFSLKAVSVIRRDNVFRRVGRPRYRFIVL